MKYFFSLILIWVFLITTPGCSGSLENPVTKEDYLNGISVIDTKFNIDSYYGLMGAYNLRISPDSENASLMPLRESLKGESYIVSGLGFFTVYPCPDCLKLKSLGLDGDGHLVLGMEVKHPFEKGDPLEPPTGINRLDLDTFDLALVMGVLTYDGPDPAYFPLMDAAAYTDFLVNANGYTREVSDVFGDGAALPYVICYEDENNNRFEMGTDYQPFNLVLNPGERTDFTLFLTMGYGASATKPERLNPTYYVPEFNRKAAWKVDVIPPEGDYPPEQGNTWDDTDTSSEYIVTIDIYDWNHGATIASTYPDPLNPDHISASSDVTSVTVEVPGMTNALVNASTVDTSTNGWDDPLTYTASFANENALPAGEYTSLVKVTDSRIPGTVLIGGEADTLAHSSDGLLPTWHDIPEFATYQTFTATVVEGEVSTGWADTWGDLENDYGFGVAVDQDGDAYVTGYYETETYIGDAFLRKYSSDGVLLWEKIWGDTGNDRGYAVATDSLGYVYVTGVFEGSVNFDPDGSDIHVSTGGPNSYLTKFNSDGNHQWAVTWGGSIYYGDEGFGVAVDDSNDGVWVTGSFVGSNVDFDPSVGGTHNHSSHGGKDLYLSKFDSSGNFIWAGTWGGASDDGWFGGVDCDHDGNAYVTGYFHGTNVDFDPEGGGSTHSSDGRDVFISKFNTNGNFQWVRVWGGTSSFDEGYSVAVDSSNYIYVTGRWEYIIDFDPSGGVDERTSNGHFDVFLSKFDSDGNYQGVQTWGGTSYEISNAVCIDANDNVYVNGYFRGTDVDFDPTSGTDLFSSNDSTVDVFLTKLDSSGGYLWTRIWGGLMRDEGNAVAADDSENVFTTGSFQDVVDFAPTDPPCNNDPDEHISNSKIDAFITKYLMNGCWE